MRKIIFTTRKLVKYPGLQKYAYENNKERGHGFMRVERDILEGFEGVKSRENCNYIISSKIIKGK